MAKSEIKKKNVKKSKNKKTEKNKILKIISNIIKIILSVFFVFFILLVCLQRFSNNKVALFDYRLFTVISGSMRPEYEVGDVLIAKDIPASEIKVGDKISYLGNNGTFYGKVITHKVIKIEQKDGKYVFHTKGNANIVEDPYVEEDQLYGVIVYKTKILSFIHRFIGKKAGFMIFIVVPLFYIIGSEVLISLLEKEEERHNKSKK